jgi:uncharacterized membrane protein YhaH (DUF805 family)
MSYALAILLQQQELTPEQTAAAGAAATVFMVIYFAVILLIVASMWKIFVKAGKPVWWFLLMLIPFVNLVILALVCISLAKNFGKGAGFGLGLLFLSPIFYPILAFGDARYQPQPQ